MAEADGRIYIDTDLDTDGMILGSKEIEAHMRKMAKTVSASSEKQKIAFRKQANAFVKQNQALAQQRAKVKALEQEYEQLSKKKIETDEFKEIGKQIDNDTVKLNRLQKAQEEFLATGGKENSSTYQRRQLQIEELTNSIRYAKAEQQELLNSGGAYKAVDTSSVEEQLLSARQKLANMNNALGLSYEDLKTKINGVNTAHTKQASVGGRLKNAFSKLGASVKKVASKIRSLHKNTNKSNMSMGKMLATSVLFSAVFRAISTVTEGVKTGFENLAQYSDETNESLSMLKSSLSKLKNSLATAFAPILSVVAPILSSFINLLSNAITKIGMLVAALTGKNTFEKAVDVQEDYAASLQNTASGAKDAEKATKGYLSPIDEINKMDKQDETDISGTGGTVSPSEMFETVEIASQFGDIAEKIKEAWKNADFTEIGTIIGTKLADALNSINWEKIQTVAGKLGKSLATLFNGILGTPGLWILAGTTFGNAVNTILEFGNQFVENFDWAALGTAIGDFLTGAIQTIDWNKVGSMLGTGFSGIVTVIKTTIENTDWKALGTGIMNAIGSFFENIDWSEIGGTLSSAFVALCDFAVGLIEGIDWSALPGNIIDAIVDFFTGFDWEESFESLGELIGTWLAAKIDIWQGLEDECGDVAIEIGKYFAEKMEEAGYDKDKSLAENGKAIITGMNNGILDALKNIGTWINDNMFKPFMEGLMSAFGIKASSSTKMKDKGKTLVTGFKSGIQAPWAGFLEFWGKKKDDVLKKFSDIKEKFIAKGKQMVSGIKSGIANRWSDFKTYWSNKKSEIINKYSDIKEKFNSKGQQIISGMRGGISNKWSDFKTYWSDRRKAIIDTFKDIKDDMKKVGENIVNGIIDGIKGIWKTLTSWADDIKDLFDISISEPTVSTSSSSGATGTTGTTGTATTQSAASTASVSWYAKGGVFNAPSIIGVGEAGKETVLPLENKRTMRMLASSILAAMPIPYMATGAVLPTMAVNNQQKDMSDTLHSIAGKLNQQGIQGGSNSSSSYRFTANLNRRTLFDEFITEAKIRQAQSGRNPFELA